MSTVAATNLKNASSSVNNAVTTSGGDLTNAAGVSFMGGSKNLLYNGACQIAQRNTSVASITTSGYYTADRWNFLPTNFGTWTQSVENDAPSGSGLRKSLKVLCTTADAAPAAGDANGIIQSLEGQDVQRIAKGTASAQQLTLSFWVKSNVTGTYVAELIDADNTRHVCGSYTISASATWEKKSITFPADTTGVLDNDNAASLTCRWWLGAGTDFTSGTLATTWASTTSANRAVGQTNLAAATNNYWQVTGVQLEVGPVATSFEFKSYGQELRECQRYYYRITPQSGGLFSLGMCFSTTTAGANVPFPVTMRVAPTALEQSGTAAHYAAWNSSGNQVTNSAVPTHNGVTSNQTAVVNLTVASGLTAGNATGFYSVNTSAYVAWSAEL